MANDESLVAAPALPELAKQAVTHLKQNLLRPMHDSIVKQVDDQAHALLVQQQATQGEIVALRRDVAAAKAELGQSLVQALNLVKWE